MASEWALNQRRIGRGPAKVVIGGKGVKVRDGARAGVVHVAYSNGTKDHPEPYAVVDFHGGPLERVDLSRLTLA